MRVLIVEDEEGIASFLKAGLEAEYFAVDVAEDGERGSYLGRTNEYDIIILDNMLPKMSGAQICESIRKAGKTTPIIMLSVRSEMSTKVELLNKGADDYLTKPFSLEELVARIRALLRRPAAISSDILQVDDLVMDIKKHVTRRGKKEIYLTKKEFMLLELLLKKKGEPVSRAAILEHVWDMSIDLCSNTVESHILNLRKKTSLRGKKQLIFTIPSVGYKIDDGAC